MAKQTINVGVTDNDGTGSTIRAGGQIINSNFTEIYSAIGDGSTITFDVSISSPSDGDGLIYDSASTKFITSPLVTSTSTNTFTNKTFDANGTGNSITNLEVADLASGVLDTDLSSVSASDDTLASAKAIKTYVDNEVSGLSSTLTIRDDSSTTDNVVIGTDTLSFAGGTGLSSTVTNNTVTFDIDSTVATLTGSQVLTGKTINAPDNTITNISNSNLSGSAGITNANLANSTISLLDETSTAGSVSLGGTLRLNGGTGIDTSVSSDTYTISIDNTVATASSSTVFTNKTFDANGTGNSLTNIEVADLASGVLDTDLTSVSASDDTLASAKAIKTYVDANAGGGVSWQTEIVADGSTITSAVAGEGYFINTTSATHTINLPSSPSLGDEVSIIDAAGTFDTNNLTVGRNGENIQGSAADLTVSVERAGFTLVYLNATQGWLLKDK